jgi:Zn-dependent protease with chaperone function
MKDAAGLEQTIRRLEAVARHRPRLFKLRVLLLALGGYAYVLAILGLVAWVSLLHIALAAAGIPLMLIILHALWVRVKAPPGIVLESADAPKLFREVESLRQRMWFPRFHVIQMTEDFNAGVAQVPRLGPFGWQKNYLNIGLPLLLSLSPEQFRAVLAHEFYHLFGAHSRFSTWLYRLGETWNRLMDKLEKRRHRGVILFVHFFRWYVPRLSAHVSALVRANEYGADRLAADLAGPRELSDALIQIELNGIWLREVFWPQIHAQQRHLPEPPPDIYLRLREKLAAAARLGFPQAWLERALATETNPDESHPALRQRLAAIGAEPRLPPPVAESAAEVFLGQTLGHLLQEVSRRWQQSAAAGWRQRHEHLQQMQRRLEELASLSQLGEHSPELAWEFACLTEELAGPDAALPLYTALLARAPGHAAAHFAVGRLLLAQRRPEGAAHIEQSMKLDSDFVLPGCSLLYSYFLESGQHEFAWVWQTRTLRHRQERLLAERERTQFAAGDKFYTVNLSPEQRYRLAGQMAGSRAVRAVYLVRKEVRHLPDKPCHVVAVQWRWWYPIWNELRMLEGLARDVPLPVPGAVWVALSGLPRRVRNRIRSVPRACVFRRPWFRGRGKVPEQG